MASEIPGQLNQKSGLTICAKCDTYQNRAETFAVELLLTGVPIEVGRATQYKRVSCIESICSNCSRPNPGRCPRIIQLDSNPLTATTLLVE